jgi:acyl-CoA synthetase (AMP-forming)/AMP-acid ligase II
MTTTHLGPAEPAATAGDGLPLTVPRLLAARAAARGDHRFLVCDQDVLTYAEAERRSAALAKGLLATGAGHGTHVGILHPNGTSLVVAWLAAARIGAVSLPFSTFSTAAELRTLLRGADVEVLLAATSYRSRDFLSILPEAVPGLALTGPPPLFLPAVPALRRIAFEGAAAPVSWSVAELVEAGARVSDDVLRAAEEAVSPADRMVMIHTSGSTSAPKGVIHQHGTLIRHIANLNEVRHYTAEEIYFSNSPFFWIGGFGYVLLATLISGATLVCSNAAAAGDVLDLLERTKPTIATGFAASVAHLAKDPSFPTRDLGSIRRGNLWPILPAPVRPADPELRHNMLGMSEAGSVALLDGDESDQPPHRRGSFGRPAPGFETRVVDPETGADCPVGEPGELWLRAPYLMEGYYGRERDEAFDPDGWFHTGDQFAVDADGLYYFKGRRGEMIKTAGANVAPREVEAAIKELTGFVSHVVGVDDEARGQVVAAAVRVPAGAWRPDLAELRTGLRSLLSAYKVPKKIVLMADEEVPMMSSGKLDLRALKARLADADV